MKRIQWHLIVAFLVGLGVPTICFGQATGSAITGVVKDASDAVVAGATVTVTNVETGITRTRESDSAGRYRIGELPPGAYQVTVTMPGFARETRTGVGVMVGQELSLHFTLQVGAVEQEVVVTGEVPLVETTTAAVATVVTQEQLRELPLNGRSFTDLVTLQVAAVTPTNASTALGYGTGPQLSVAGGRTDTNSFTLDGTDMNATSNNTPGSAARVQLGVDTVREYQVITTNPKAEYGRGSGATINAVTRSGTNTFHGAAFEFLRNDNLDARRFVDAGDLPPFKRNQLGATLGGPIRRDKTFFFAAYEGLQQREGETRTYQVPTLAARQGIGILNPGEVIDPRVIPFLNLYPEPNGRDLGRGVAEYKEAPPVPLSENYGSLRVDHTFSANDSLFGRYTISRANQGNIIALKTKDNLYTQNQYVTLQEDHVLDPTKVNTFRAGYNRSTMIQGPIPPEGSEGLTFVPGTNMPMGSLSMSGLNSIGESGTFTIRSRTRFSSTMI